MDGSNACRVVPALGDVLPVVFNIPHAGRHYGADFRSRQPLNVLRRAEDGALDAVLEDAPNFGVTTLQALFPRTYIDPDRSETDLDPALLAGRWSGPLGPTNRTRDGMGLIHRHLAPGVPIYDRSLAPVEVNQRLEAFWRPYRARVRETVQRLREQFGHVLYVQWQALTPPTFEAGDTMPVRQADIVLADMNSSSCGAGTMAMLRDVFAGRGYRVRINQPETASDLMAAVADPGRGVEAVQILVNRRLFWDSAALELAEGAAKLRATVNLVSTLLANRYGEPLALSRSA